MQTIAAPQVTVEGRDHSIREVEKQVEGLLKIGRGWRQYLRLDATPLQQHEQRRDDI